MEVIQKYDELLVSRLVAGLGERGYVLVSPERGAARSTLVAATYRHSERNQEIRERLLQQGIDIRLRRGNLRFSPHLHNTSGEIDQVLDALDAVAP